MKIEVRNEVELKVVNKALEVYRNKLKKQKQNVELMKTKKFNYGDVVIKKGTSYFDNVFGTGDGEIGVIVGHFDIDGIDTTKPPYSKPQDNFRVHYDQRNNYVGVNAEYLELYKGEIPEHLKDVKFNQIQYIDFYI